MTGRKPDWLKVSVRGGLGRDEVERLLEKLSLHTVCEEAGCPNMMECFGRKTATFMILGCICTRDCTFCGVRRGWPQPVDAMESGKVAQAVKELGLRHAVITSVTRDDLDDGGADQFAKVVREIRALNGDSAAVEVLIPDFRGDIAALKTVVSSRPEVVNHNIETVPRLYAEVRPTADYRRSLRLLKSVKELDGGVFTKSGLMLGLGEDEGEVLEALMDLRAAGCDFLTIGQYLSPSVRHHPVVEYIHPDIFAGYREKGLEMGFLHVASAPLVRSSYHADRAVSLNT